MGKTAVFVLATLHQLSPVAGECHVVVLCHTRELAFQIQKEYERFSKYLPDVKSKVFFGGVNVQVTNRRMLGLCFFTISNPSRSPHVNSFFVTVRRTSRRSRWAPTDPRNTSPATTGPVTLIPCPNPLFVVSLFLSIVPVQAEVPHIAVGTPGRILDLATKRKVLDLSKVGTCPTALHGLSSALDEARCVHAYSPPCVPTICNRRGM